MTEVIIEQILSRQSLAARMATHDKVINFLCASISESDRSQLRDWARDNPKLCEGLDTRFVYMSPKVHQILQRRAEVATHQTHIDSLTANLTDDEKKELAQADKSEPAKVTSTPSRPARA